MTSHSTLLIEKLNSYNFPIWKAMMKVNFDSQEYGPVIDGTITSSSLGSMTQAKFDQLDKQGKAFIFNNVGSSFIPCINIAKTAHDALTI
eukprot:c9375_g1_i1 orf=43-312(+)